MKKIDLGQSLTLLANLGVIAGIGFLAVELRQNNEFAASEAEATRYLAAVEAFSIVAENTEIAEIFYKSTQNQPLSGLEEQRIKGWWIRTLVLNQWGQKSMPADDYVPFLEMQRRNNRNHKTYRETFEENLAIFEPEFIRFMQENVFNER